MTYNMLMCNSTAHL